MPAAVGMSGLGHLLPLVVTGALRAATGVLYGSQSHQLLFFSLACGAVSTRSTDRAGCTAFLASGTGIVYKYSISTVQQVETAFRERESVQTNQSVV